jgi:ferritin-like metal-binding protein YciE
MNSHRVRPLNSDSCALHRLLTMPVNPVGDQCVDRAQIAKETAMKPNLESMMSLYVEQITDLLSAEKQLVRALPKAVKAANSPELRDALSSHLEETNGHVERLEQIIKGLEEKPGAHKCEAMEGLLKEAAETIEAKGDPDVKDAAIIAAAQRIEHYEIAGYGCARTFARRIGREDDAALLQTTLDEEHGADEALTGIAEKGVNDRASAV